MITLNEHSGVVVQEIYPLIAGLGIGVLFHTAFQVVTISLPRSDLAQATGAFFLIRFIGTTAGLVSLVHTPLVDPFTHFHLVCCRCCIQQLMDRTQACGLRISHRQSAVYRFALIRLHHAN